MNGSEWFKAFVLANVVIILLSLLVLAIIHYPLQVFVVIALAFLTPMIKTFRELRRKQEQPTGFPDKPHDGQEYKSWVYRGTWPSGRWLAKDDNVLQPWPEPDQSIKEHRDLN